jgi:hemolysin activation/secretion protein
MRTFFWRLSSHVLLGSTLLFADPPPVPSGGVIERQLQEEYQAQPLDSRQEAPEIEIDVPKEHLDVPDGTCVEVKRIALHGVESLPVEEVHSWVEPFEGRTLCMREIYEVCEAIRQGYGKKGYFLARAYPPPQTIEEGVLTIEVLEGRLGAIVVEGNQRYSTRFIEGYFSPLQGKALQYDRFMRAILLLNENKGLEAGAVFSKGKEVGTADVVLRVRDERPLSLYLNANNYGRKLTTNFRTGGRFEAGNLFTYGDLFSLVEVVGFPMNALYFTSGSYRVPLNRNGSFLELSYLYSFFTVEELTALEMKGNSNIATLKGGHAITRSRSLRMDGFAQFDYVNIKNLSLGQTTSYDKLRILRGGFSLDEVGSPKARHYLNVRASVGIPDFLGGLSAVSNECSRQGAGGLFVKLNAEYDYLQSFMPHYYLTAHASIQGSPYKLAVPEEVYLGGADTVRGFPVAVVLGDSGYHVNLEWKMPPPLLADMRFFMAKRRWKEVVQVVGFLDHGGAFFYGGSDNFLWGSGIGVRFMGPGGLSLSIDVGFPLNHDNFSTGAMTYIKVTGQPF